jgi:RNA polymerase sigma-70 factor (family 1)
MKQNSGYNLVALFNSGDEKAFQAIYEELYPGVFLLANKMLDNTQEAQDVCADSFIKLFQTEEKFDDLENIKAFLYRITRNACLDLLKKQERHSLGNKHLGYLMEQHSDFFKSEIEVELAATIYKSIENLPTKCRKVVEMTMMGFDTAEIAVHLNITVSTVRNQKARGIKLLRIALLGENELSGTIAVISLLVTLLTSQKPLN